MRRARNSEMNYQNTKADDDYNDTLIQPYHQEWASQLAKESTEPNYGCYDSYGNSDNREDIQRFNRESSSRNSEDKDVDRNKYDRGSSYRSEDRDCEGSYRSDDRDRRYSADRDRDRYNREGSYPSSDYREDKDNNRFHEDGKYKSRSDDRRSEKSPKDSTRRSDRGNSSDSRRSSDREKRSRRHSRERSRRYSRSHSRERSRRRARSRSRDRARSRSRSRSRRDRDRYSRKADSREREPPSNTIILRGLPEHIRKQDIVAEVLRCNLDAKQVRLIRKKLGVSRGFAFVEFNTIEEAQRWMEMSQGSVTFGDQYRASMQYAVPRYCTNARDDENPESNFYPPIFLADWTCIKCGGINFKRRENCFKCSSSRQESALGMEGTDEISETVTTRIIIQNLDVLTKEEDLRAELESRTPGLMSLIVNLNIPRDTTTSLSRGLAYLNFNNEDDSKIAYDTLNNCDPPFTVADKTVVVSYCLEEGVKKNSGSKKSVPKPSRGTSFTIADVPKLAAYSADLYAKNAEQKQQYLMYYTNYYMQQIAQGITISMPQTQSDETNSAAAVAQQAIMKMQNKNRINNQAQAMGMSQIQVPTGSDGKVYAIPDISSYYYDQSSGYYYDVLTGLYYDPNTQYYYNSQINKFLYWDNTKRTYLLAPEGTEATVSAAAANAVATANQQQSNAADQNKSKIGTENSQNTTESKTKNDKVKVAKRIAKDMERWAKTLNQKKENTKRVVEPPSQPIYQNLSHSKSPIADICFSMVEKSERSLGKYENPLAKYSTSVVCDLTESPLEPQKPVNPPSQYSAASLNEITKPAASKQQLIDFDKLACLICKRQFASREILIKHTKMSALHKQNLALLGINT